MDLDSFDEKSFMNERIYLRKKTIENAENIVLWYSTYVLTTGCQNRLRF